jgi:hypothetical protein
MEMVQFPYRGYSFKHSKVSQTTGSFVVEVTTDNSLWLAKLGGGSKIFDDQSSIDGAISKAKAFVDGVIAGSRLRGVD